ncbi:MAG: hypothetical protein ABIH39_04650 [Candidatus Margulisiibacteriota bacterium]
MWNIQGAVLLKKAEIIENISEKIRLLTMAIVAIGKALVIEPYFKAAQSSLISAKEQLINLLDINNSKRVLDIIHKQAERYPANSLFMKLFQDITKSCRAANQKQTKRHIKP